MKAKGVAVTPIVSTEIVGVVLVEVSFAITIFIVEAVDLASVEDEDAVLINMDSDWLVESGGEALPGDIL